MKIVVHSEKLAPAPLFGPLVEAEKLGGGLSAELLENRSFEAGLAPGRQTLEEAAGWEIYPAGSDAALKVKTDRPLYAETPRYLRLTAGAGAGVKNASYGGFAMTKGVEYRLSFWLRAYEYRGKAQAGVIAGGRFVVQKTFKVRADGKWRKYAFRLKPKGDVVGGEFVFVLLSSGMVHLDAFSFKPANAVLGVFRRDTATLLKALSPTVLRFPDREGAYRWKDSVGDAERRSASASDTGVGYYEYFRLAEYVGAKPLPVVRGEVQDVLDLAEFANGSRDTVWGKLRTELGHPAPFDLTMVAVPFHERDKAAFGEISEHGLTPVFLPEETAPAAGDWEGILKETALYLTEGLPYSAPLFGKLGASFPLIAHDGARAYATSRYHVRRLSNLYAGDRTLATEAEGLTVSASEREGTTYLKVVNLSEQAVRTETEADYEMGDLNRIILMTEDIPAPYDVAPTSAHAALLPPKSFAVLIFRK